jgi:hypothetical protein
MSNYGSSLIEIIGPATGLLEIDLFCMICLRRLMKLFTLVFAF